MMVWIWNPEKLKVPLVAAPVFVPTILHVILSQGSFIECPDCLCQSCVVAENNSSGGTINQRMARNVGLHPQTNFGRINEINGNFKSN